MFRRVGFGQTGVRIGAGSASPAMRRKLLRQPCRGGGGGIEGREEACRQNMDEPRATVTSISLRVRSRMRRRDLRLPHAIGVFVPPLSRTMIGER
jgi:hypothetical protein